MQSFDEKQFEKDFEKDFEKNIEQKFEQKLKNVNISRFESFSFLLFEFTRKFFCIFRLYTN